MFKRICFFILASIFSHSLFSQNIQGLVVDARTKEPLPFVNIYVENTRMGTTTNIDGEFTLSNVREGHKLCIKYLGYLSDTLLVQPEMDQPLTIGLEPVTFDLEEVVILPGENPANRIIDKVIRNRPLNNPESLRSFAFRSYNKMYFTFEGNDQIKPDSITSAFIHENTAKQHLLFIETVNQKKFLHPDRYAEEIVASKVSGFKDPIFSLIASQVQSFSFYNDFFEILDKRYLNPISKNSTQRYFFLLQDTLFNHDGDSIFVISYRPKKGKHFEGLKGFLHINTNGYAIQSVVAQPLEKDQGMKIEITQNYERVNGEHWFPRELITKIIFEDASSSSGVKGYDMVALGTSYIKDIQINPEISPKDFGAVEVKVSPEAPRQPEAFWNAERVKPLEEIEKETYRTMDSLSKALNLEQKISGFETLINGNLPVKCFDLPLKRLVDYNEHEGLRLGLGVMTNNKLSPYFSVGGYFGYGFKDKRWKYGGDLLLNLHRKTESTLHLSYFYDVKEKGGYEFLEKSDFTSTEIYRKYMIETMDLEEKLEVSFSLLSLKFLRMKLFLNQSFITTHDNLVNEGLSTTVTSEYGFSEVGVRIRYAYKEKYMQTLKAKYSLGTDYPILYANLIRGTHWFKGEFDYTRYEAKVTQTLKFRTLGKSSLALVGGLTTGDVPLTKLYNGHGSYQPFSLEAANSFGTMRMNEFFVDRFISLFVKHDFGNRWIKTETFAPRWVLVHNLGFGSFSGNRNQYAVPVKTFEKGYFEGGILINNILTQSFLGYGIGIFYRYGPYAFEKTADNFAYKLSLTFGL